MNGYMGQILEINLSTSSINSTPLDENLVNLFLGGAGYACASLFHHINKNTDPLGPENILFFMTGPLTGTFASSTGRMVVCAKSPLTGVWGESNSGSDVCVQIKKAGYDGILIYGKAEIPVYLRIKNEKIEIIDAKEIWGKGIYETTQYLKKIDGFKNGRVIAIGPAGENLVKYANIGSEERAFGRTGLGAVMGSKLLKAIIIEGSKNISVAKPNDFKEHAIKTNKDLMEIFTNKMMQELGTSGGLDMYNVNGELPVKYYHMDDFDEFDNISGATLSESYLKKNRHCFSCPIGCGRIVSVDEDLARKNDLPSQIFEGPEYETIAAFGSLMLNGDLLKIIKANYLCNDFGLDTISTGSIIALLMDLIEQKKLFSSDLNEISLQWGNMDAVFTLIKKIALRDGIGNILAEGVNDIAKKYNIDSDQIAAIHNSHVTLHDMRSSNGMAIAYGISPHYGGSHNSCDAYMVSTGLEIEDMDIISIDPKENSPEMAIMAAKTMDYRAFYSSAIMCVFTNPSGDQIAKYLEFALGKPFTKEIIKEIGQRVLTLKRLFNLKMGHKPRDEKIPKILLTPIEGGGQDGNIPDVEMLYREFYKYEEWDPITGMPSKEKINRLGLNSYSDF